MTDCTGSKRFYLISAIKAHIEQLDNIELAIILAWLKSGDLYKWGADLLTKNGGNAPAQDVIDHAESIAKAAEAAETAKQTAEIERRLRENKTPIKDLHAGR